MRPLEFDVEGARLSGWEARPAGGEAPGVLLLHAGGERARVWQPVARRLVDAHGIRCVAIDQRGHGASTGTAEHIEDFGRDTCAVLAAEPSPCVVVGASLGGFSAIEALSDPAARSKIVGIILVDVVPDPDPTRARRYLTSIGMDLAHRPLIDDILDAGPRLLELIGRKQPATWLVRANRSTISDDEVERLRAAVPGLAVSCIDTDHLVAREAPLALADIIATACKAWGHGATP